MTDKDEQGYKICIIDESLDVIFETSVSQQESNERRCVRQSDNGTRACPGGRAV